MATGLLLFDKLPLELRLEVYRYYISDVLEWPTGEDPLILRDKDLENPNSLCQVSDTLHDEIAHTLIYPTYSFAITKPQKYPKDVKLACLDSTYGMKLEYVRKLTFHIDPGLSLYRSDVVTYWPHNARAFRERMPQLETARIGISTRVDPWWKSDAKTLAQPIIGIIRAFRGVTQVIVCLKGRDGPNLAKKVFDMIRACKDPNTTFIATDDAKSDVYWPDL